MIPNGLGKFHLHSIGTLTPLIFCHTEFNPVALCRVKAGVVTVKEYITLAIINSDEAIAL